MPVNTVPGTPGYDPVPHFESLVAHAPKQRPMGTHVSPPSTGTYPDPAEVANYAENRRMVDRRLGTGGGRRGGDGMPSPDTLFGDPAGRRAVDFRGSGPFHQTMNPPHVGPAPEPGNPLPTSHEDLNAMLARMGLGAGPEPGLGQHVRNFFNDEAGTAYWPPKGSPMPPNASSNGDALMEGYALAPPRQATATKPAPTGTRPGPIPMKPGPAPRTKPAVGYPGEAGAHLQHQTEVRLDRPGFIGQQANTGTAPQTFAARKPSFPAPSGGVPQYPAGTSGDDLVAAFESLRPPGLANPHPPAYVPPPANVASAGTAETFMAPAQEIAGQIASLRPANPAAQRAGEAVARFGNAANEFVKPKLGGVKGAAGAAGLGLLFDTVNDPQGMANMVRHPGQAGQQMFEGFGAGVNRIAGGQVGAQDLVTAVGNSLGMGSAYNAGTKMGNTIYDGFTAPRRTAGNFANGVGVIRRGMGF